MVSGSTDYAGKVRGSVSPDSYQTDVNGRENSPSSPLLDSEQTKLYSGNSEERFSDSGEVAGYKGMSGKTET